METLKNINIMSNIFSVKTRVLILFFAIDIFFSMWAMASLLKVAIGAIIDCLGD